MRNAVLVSAVRTPVGKKGGVFKNLKRMDLFVPVIQEALKRINLDPKEVDEAICGNNPIARTPARYAWLAAGFPVEAAGLTVNRACGTGLTAITLAGAFIQGGVGDTYMCGGIEMDSRPVALVSSSQTFGDLVLAFFDRFDQRRPYVLHRDPTSDEEHNHLYKQ